MLERFPPWEVSSIKINVGDEDAPALIIQHVWWNAKRQGDLLVRESDKKGTYYLSSPSSVILLCRRIFIGVLTYGEGGKERRVERKSRRTTKGEIVNFRIPVLKGADRSASNIHHFPGPLQGYSAKSFVYYQVMEQVDMPEERLDSCSSVVASFYWFWRLGFVGFYIWNQSNTNTLFCCLSTIPQQLPVYELDYCMYNPSQIHEVKKQNICKVLWNVTATKTVCVTNCLQFARSQFLNSPRKDSSTEFPLHSRWGL